MERPSHNGPYATHIKRTEHTETMGYDTSCDYVTFDDVDSAHEYAVGKSAYDHLDYVQTLASYEYPISITDNSDNEIMKFAFEPKRYKAGYYEGVLTQLSDDTFMYENDDKKYPKMTMKISYLEKYSYLFSVLSIEIDGMKYTDVEHCKAHKQTVRSIGLSLLEDGYLWDTNEKVPSSRLSFKD